MIRSHALHPDVLEKARAVLQALADGKLEIWMVAHAKEVLPAFAEHRRVEKMPIPSVTHHDQVRHELELEEEKVSEACWQAVMKRTALDHRGRCACEACHREKPLEPHHLEMGAGGRPDLPHLVMGLCRDCHTLSSLSAHRAPVLFARSVVIPWARVHRFELPNRKEYRDA